MSTKHPSPELPSHQSPLLTVSGAIRRVVGRLMTRGQSDFDGYGSGAWDEARRFGENERHAFGPTLFSGLSYTYPELERDMRRRRARERMIVIQLLILMGNSGR